MRTRLSWPGWAANPALWFALIVAAMSVAAGLVGVPIGRMTEVVIYTLYAAGVNVLLAYTGLVPFGAALFFGTASYVAALFAIELGGPEPLALLAGTVFSALLGGVVGLIILRRRGLYFSLLTLAFSQLAFELAFKWTAVTGGEGGLQHVPRLWFPTDRGLHVFTVLTAAGVLAGLWQVMHAPVGRTLQAVRDNEMRARCLGYDTGRYKLVAFVLCAAVVGYAGGLLSFLIRGAYANNLSWEHAADPLLIAVLGGVHQFLGPFWGATAFIVLQDQLSAYFEQWWLVFAPVIMAFALFSSEGVVGAWQRITRRPRWTLTRARIPDRPDVIAPFQTGRPALDRAVPLLSISGLSKSFGSLVTADRISLDVMPCRLHSFIGPNGAGKTTFFNMITGLLPPDAGTIRLAGRDITHMPVHRRIRLGLGRSFQIISLFGHLTAFETVRVAVQARDKRRFGVWRDAHGLVEVNARTWSLLAAVHLDARAAVPFTSLSHGEQRLLDIAVALAADGDLLLLDEPLAGLAEESRIVVSRLVRALADTHAVLLIEHDIDRVLELSDRISVLHGGRLIADGRPAAVARNPEVIAAYLGQSGHTKAEAPVRRTHAAPGAPLLTLSQVRAGYGGSEVLAGIDITVRRNEVVALLGRNGVGKTTTLAAITGLVHVDAGRIVFGDHDITNRPAHDINRLGLALVPEGRRLFPNLTVAENLRIAQRTGGTTLAEVLVLLPLLRRLLSQRASGLSGGERQMVAIARALMAPADLILLDEPFEGLAPWWCRRSSRRSRCCAPAPASSSSSTRPSWCCRWPTAPMSWSAAASPSTGRPVTSSTTRHCRRAYWAWCTRNRRVHPPRRRPAPERSGQPAPGRTAARTAGLASSRQPEDFAQVGFHVRHVPGSSCWAATPAASSVSIRSAG